MPNNIGTAYVQILPSAGGLGNGIADELGNQMPKAGKKGGALLGGGLIAGLKTLGIGMVVKEMFTEGAALEQALGGVETLYDKSADKVIANANRAWKTAGMSANEYMENSTAFAATLINSLGGDTKAAANYADRAIQDMADNANKMGTSLDSITQTYQSLARGNFAMLDNLKLGYGGTKTEMQRLLKDASQLDDEMKELGVTVDANDMSFANIVNAISVMQKHLKITGTTAKEASVTFSGSLLAMMAAAKNVLGALVTGKGLTGAFNGLIQAVTDFAFNNAIPMILRIVKQLPKLMQGVLTKGIPGILKGLVKAIPQIFNALTKMVNDWAVRLPAIIDKLGTDPKTQNAGVKIAKGIALGLIKGLPKLMQAMVRLANASIQAFARNMPRFAKMGLTAAGRFAGSMLANIKSKIAGVVNVILAPFKKAVARVKALFPIKIGKLLKGMKLPKWSLQSGARKYKELGRVQYPTGLKVKWNAEGGIFDSSQIIGYGVGEKGAEAIVPLDKFWQKLDGLTASVQGGGGGGLLNLIITLDGEQIGQSTVNYINGQTLQFNASPIL